MRIRAVLVLLGIALAAPGCSESEICGNSTPIWVHRVLAAGERCEDCVELSFDGEILDQSSFRVHGRPEVVLGRCSVEFVQVRPDGVTLLVSSGDFAPVRHLRETMLESDPEGLVLLRLAASAEPFAVLGARDTRRQVVLFDLGSPAEIERFVAELGPEGPVAYEDEPISLDGVVDEEEVEREADELLGRLERQKAKWEQLQEALESGEDQQTTQKILDKLETSQPSAAAD